MRPLNRYPAGSQEVTQPRAPAFGSAEDEFVAEYARKHLVRWADHQVSSPSAPLGELTAKDPARYVEFAKQKKWLSADGSKVLAAGFKVAAAFLRR